MSFHEIQAQLSQSLEMRTPESERLGKRDASVSDKATSILESSAQVKKDVKESHNISRSTSGILNSAISKVKESVKSFFGDKLSSSISAIGRAFSSIFHQVSPSEKISANINRELIESFSESNAGLRDVFSSSVEDASSASKIFDRTPPRRSSIEKYLEQVQQSGTMKNFLEEIKEFQTTPFSKSVMNSSKNLEMENTREAQLCFDVLKNVNNPEELNRLGVQDLTKSLDSSDKMITWTFKIGDQKYEINKTDDFHYDNGFKHSDLIKRGNLIFDAANKSELEGLRADTLKKLTLLSNKKLSVKDHLDEGLSILAQAFFQVENKMKENDSNYDLARKEAEFVMERGRPIIVNFFDVEAGGEKRTFVGMHKPMSKETIPSSIQDKVGLANYVTTSGGVLQGEDVKMHYTGIRHSRPSPIAIKNGCQRRAIAAANVKQSIEDVVKNMDVNKENSESRPLLVSIAPTTLFTAKQLDFIRNKKKIAAGKWTGESETMQLEETMQAYRLFDGCPMKTNIRGQEVWIKPVIHHMNFGVNPAGADQGMPGKLPDSTSQLKLNAYGMLSQHHFVKLYFKEALSDDNTKERVLKFLSGDLSKLEDQYDNFKEKIHHDIQKNQRALDKMYSQYGDQPTKSNEEKIENLERKIAKSYAKLDAFALGIVKEQKQAYLQRIESGDFERELAEVKNNLNFESASILQDHADFMRSVFTKAHKNPATVVDVPAIRNMLYQKLGIASIFYCKSAEDRTGNVEIKTFARMMYENIAGHPPGIVDCTKESYQNHLFMQLFNASPSLNNTEQNSNARGLQISPLTNPKRLTQQIKEQKRMAGFAKSVPKEARKLATAA